MTPAIDGVEADVPLMVKTFGEPPVSPQSWKPKVHSTKIGLLLPAALAEMSGTWRMPAAMTGTGSEPTGEQVGTVFWYAGRLNTTLMPPPPARFPPSFHASS